MLHKLISLKLLMVKKLCVLDISTFKELFISSGKDVAALIMVSPTVGQYSL